MKDIYPGSVDSNPTQFILFNSLLFFAATDAATGTELWKTDDNAGVLLFVANDGVFGQELWKSDGTAAGTSVVKDLWVGDWTGTVALQKIAGAGEVLVIGSNAVTGNEPWIFLKSALQ